MERYSVSLVFVKNVHNGFETMLRVLITNATNKEEALGSAIIHFEEETKGYNLANKVIIEVFSKDQNDAN